MLPLTFPTFALQSSHPGLRERLLKGGPSLPGNVETLLMKTDCIPWPCSLAF